MKMTFWEDYFGSCLFYINPGILNNEEIVIG